MLALRDKISDELKPLIIHIKNKDYYDLYEFMREVFNQKMRKALGFKNDLHNRFKADQQIIEMMDVAFENKPETIDELNQEAKFYKDELKMLNIKHWVVEKNEGVIGLL